MMTGRHATSRRARHLHAVQLRHVHIPNGSISAATKLSFSVEVLAGQGWAAYYVSEQVLPDVHLEWDPIPARIDEDIHYALDGTAQVPFLSSQTVKNEFNNKQHADVMQQLHEAYSRRAECSTIRLTVYSTLMYKKNAQHNLFPQAPGQEPAADAHHQTHVETGASAVQKETQHACSDVQPDHPAEKPEPSTSAQQYQLSSSQQQNATQQVAAHIAVTQDGGVSLLLHTDLTAVKQELEQGIRDMNCSSTSNPALSNDAAALGKAPDLGCVNDQVTLLISVQDEQANNNRPLTLQLRVEPAQIMPTDCSNVSKKESNMEKQELLATASQPPPTQQQAVEQIHETGKEVVEPIKSHEVGACNRQQSPIDLFGPQCLLSNSNSEAAGHKLEPDAKVLMQMVFDMNDLVLVDPLSEDQDVTGVNQVMLRLVDHTLCTPVHVQHVCGPTLSAVVQPPLPRCLKQQLEMDTREGLSARDGLAHVDTSALTPTTHPKHSTTDRSSITAEQEDAGVGQVPEEAQGWGPLQDLGETDMRQQLLARWMADNGSAIAPLGTTYSIDRELAAQLGSDTAAQLLGQAAGGVAPSGNAGFMPSMVAMLLGSGPNSHRTQSASAAAPPSTLYIRPIIPRASAARMAQSAGASPTHALGIGVSQPVPTRFGNNFARQSLNSSTPGSRSAVAGSPTSTITSALVDHIVPPGGGKPPTSAVPRAQPQSYQPNRSNAVTSQQHRRSLSAANASAATQQQQHIAATAHIPVTHSLTNLEGVYAGSTGSPGSNSVLTANVDQNQPPSRQPGSPSIGQLVADITEQDIAHIDSGITPGVHEKVRVYDMQDLEASTRRLLAAQQRHDSAIAKRTEKQLQIAELLRERATADQQQRALQEASHKLEEATRKAHAVQAQLAELRRQADGLHALLRQQVSEQKSAAKALQAARQILEAEREALSGPAWRGAWRSIHAQAAGKANSLVATLAAVYSLGPRGAAIQLPSRSLPATNFTHLIQPDALHHDAKPLHEPQARMETKNSLQSNATDSTNRKLADSRTSSGITKGIETRIHTRSNHCRNGSVPSLDDELAVRPIDQRLEASWWAGAPSGAASASPASTTSSYVSSEEVQEVIDMALNSNVSESELQIHEGEAALEQSRPNASANKQTTSRPMAMSNAAGPVHTAVNATSSSMQTSHSIQHAHTTSSIYTNSSTFSPSTQLSLPNPVPSPSGDVPLCILGLELPANLAKRSLEGSVGWGSSPDEEQRVAAALGYVAHMVDRLAVYLDVPLRYPVIPCMSTSHICDPCPLVPSTNKQSEGFLQRSLGRILGSTSNASDAGIIGAPAQWLLGNLPTGLLHNRNQTSSPTGILNRNIHGASPPADARPKANVVILPLYTDGRDLTRFAYAVYLLNKDVELLLQAHGLASQGPNQLLRNLYTLSLAALSGLAA